VRGGGGIKVGRGGRLHFVVVVVRKRFEMFRIVRERRCALALLVRGVEQVELRWWWV